MDEINVNSTFEPQKQEICTKIGTVRLDIPYIDFFDTYLKNNVPCIIKKVSEDWECSKKWVKNNTINFEYFDRVYGELEAPVADCRNSEYNAHCKLNMNVSDYMAYMKEKSDKLLYLKDWHLKKSRPLDNFYKVPMIFASDWLNEFAVDQQEDDFMFVYIGPKDSWTPLHADVYCSYSWSVNVIGRKKWILFPPGEELKLKDKYGNLPMLFDEEKHKNVQYYEVIQEKGDGIFVPSGWFHQVLNVLDTISINHNWINGCNLPTMWDALRNSLVSVENEIQELRLSDDFSSQCQLILKSVFGMDIIMFVDFICYVGKKRLNQLQSGDKKGFGDYQLGISHIKYDLNALLYVIDTIQSDPIFTKDIVVPIQKRNTLNTLKQSIAEHCK